MSAAIETHSIASLSALYQETADLDGSADLFAPIADNPIIQALAKKGVRTEPTLRFTQAVCNGAIHPTLKPFTDSELRAVQETIDYWQFPTSWSLAVAEELAYRQYQTTGELLEPIVTPVNRIMDYIASITGAEDAIDLVFSKFKKDPIDAALGRRKIGPQFLTFHELPFFTTNAVRYMLTDLMEMMVDGIRKTSTIVSRNAICFGNLEGVRWLAERDLLTKLPADTRDACQRNSLPMLKLLLELGTPLDTDECWKAALRHDSTDTSLLDYLYEIAPEWTTAGYIEAHIRSPTGFNWALAKGIPLEYRLVFMTTDSLPVVEALLDHGFLPATADILSVSPKIVEDILILLLKRKVPMTSSPERLVYNVLTRGAVGAMVKIILHGMVFDREALWTAEYPDTELDLPSHLMIRTQLFEAGYQAVYATDHMFKGYEIDGKVYDCLRTSELLTIADAVVRHQERSA